MIGSAFYASISATEAAPSIALPGPLSRLFAGSIASRPYLFSVCLFQLNNRLCNSAQKVNFFIQFNAQMVLALKIVSA
jgi:hypothetical protein